MTRLHVGIDASLSNLVAFAGIIDGHGSRVTATRITSPPTGREARFRFPRYMRMVDELEEWLDYLETNHAIEIERIAIEHYAFASSNAYKDSLTELGALLRVKALGRVGDVLELSTWDVKEWATGKRVAEKQAMLDAMQSRERRNLVDDNEADALAILRICQQVDQATPFTNAREALLLDYITGRQVRPKKKKPKKTKRKSKHDVPPPRTLFGDDDERAPF